MLKPTKQEWWKYGGLSLGLLCLLLSFVLNFDGLPRAGHLTLGIFLLASIFWITEPIPIYATSMIVILLQVMFLSDVGLFGEGKLLAGASFGPSPENLSNYKSFMGTLADPIIVLFLGGFALAAGAVKYGLDRNLTRILLKPFGTKPSRVCLGLMIATATLSAFMSNTATTAMMMTVILPILAALKADDPFRRAVTLCIPVAANIGGVATPIGTPPNALALAALTDQGILIAFTTWMALAVPIVVLLLVFAWWRLMRMFPPAVDVLDIELGSGFNKSRRAKGMYVIFTLTVLLWVTESFHDVPASAIALIPVALMPALEVLDQKDIRGFAWEVLWLVAGGLSIGLSLSSSGLTDWLIGLVNWNALGAVGATLTFVIIGYCVANLVSNTVTAAILIPLVVGLGTSGDAQGFQLAPSVIVIGAVVSFSMMLPISTPPNAIAMSTGSIENRDMVRIGLVVGIVGVVLAVLFNQFVWPMILK